MEFNNKFVIAIATILSVLGSKFLLTELNDTCKKLLSNFFVKKLILFSILYTNTKDWKVSLMVTLLYTLVVNGLLQNETNEIDDQII